MKIYGFLSKMDSQKLRNRECACFFGEEVDFNGPGPWGRPRTPKIDVSDSKKGENNFPQLAT